MNVRSCCTEYYLISDTKILTTVNNIGILLKDVLIDLRALSFVHVKTFCHRARNLSSPAHLNNCLNVFEHFVGLVLKELICNALRDLVPFAQFKKREKHPRRSDTFSKVAGFSQLY